MDALGVLGIPRCFSPIHAASTAFARPCLSAHHGVANPLWSHANCLYHGRRSRDLWRNQQSAHFLCIILSFLAACRFVFLIVLVAAYSRGRGRTLTLAAPTCAHLAVDRLIESSGWLDAKRRDSLLAQPVRHRTFPAAQL